MAPEQAEFGRFAGRVFFWIDWVPVRLTAASFAIVGDFEDAAYCWRTQAAAWYSQSHGILLAAGGGALGVRLGDVLRQHGEPKFRPVMGAGDEAHVDHMEYAVGLIWRALVLWMFLVLVVSLAHVLG
ncbi:CobD/CbiB family protein [compost metagenome]